MTLKQILWKTKTFFKKLDHHFLVESAKIENASLPDKTAISEANVKANRMVSRKWTYHKELSFASNYFIFLKVFFFSVNQPLTKVWFDIPTTQMPIFVLFQSDGVFFDCTFSLWVSLNGLVYFRNSNF